MARTKLRSSAPWARLSPAQQAFLRLFVLSRGNLSDVERTLGVSYQTVRARLDELMPCDLNHTFFTSGG